MGLQKTRSHLHGNLHHILGGKEDKEHYGGIQGETGRNAYDKGKEHLVDLRKKSKDSIMWLHCLHLHQGRDDISFCMKVKRHYRELLDRQLFGLS